MTRFVFYKRGTPISYFASHTVEALCLFLKEHSPYDVEKLVIEYPDGSKREFDEDWLPFLNQK